MQFGTASGEERKLPEVDESRIAVASRRHVLARLRAAVVSDASGPLLVTGESGSGKTWISRQVVATLPAGWRKSFVALTGSLDALDFLTLVGDGLGLAQSSRLSLTRLRLQAALRDEYAEGRHWLLVIDDAQRGTPEVWDEIQVLADQLRNPFGFAAILVLSDTELIRMVATRRFRSFAVSLSEHHHLAPLDMDEAKELLGFSADATHQESLLLEEAQRDAAGNPRRLLRLVNSHSAVKNGPTGSFGASKQPLATTATSSANLTPVVAARQQHRAAEFSDEMPKPIDRIPPLANPSVLAAQPRTIRVEKPAAAPSPTEPPALIPAKPPIRIEDGLVEVGWEGDLEAEYGGPDELTAANAEPPVRSADTVQETVVEDHYAALQAWTEQSTNRLRARSEASQSSDPLAPAAAEPAELKRPSPLDDPEDSELRHPPTPAKIRAEGQHEFAPYSQLFTRLRQSS
jgi:general secretion pathway protein A